MGHVNKITPDKATLFVHPTSILIGENKLGKNCYIGAFCVVENCVIGDNTKIDNFSNLKDCTIGQKSQIFHSFMADSTICDECRIENSNIYDNVSVQSRCLIKNSEIYEQVSIGQECSVGVFAHIHNNCKIGNSVRIGNFVEIKKSTLFDKVKCAHLSYVGDAEVGEQTNIGAGTIFCNYDGKTKHKTCVGKKCFIGSNCTLIAPIKIDDACFVGAGSCVTKDLRAKTFFLLRPRRAKRRQL